MGVRLTGVTTLASLAVMLAVGSPAPADILSNLEVHYKFENQYNPGENSAGTDGVPCG